MEHQRSTLLVMCTMRMKRASRWWIAGRGLVQEQGCLRGVRGGGGSLRVVVREEEGLRSSQEVDLVDEGDGAEVGAGILIGIR